MNTNRWRVVLFLSVVASVAVVGFHQYGGTARGEQRPTAKSDRPQEDGLLATVKQALDQLKGDFNGLLTEFRNLRQRQKDAAAQLTELKQRVDTHRQELQREIASTRKHFSDQHLLVDWKRVDVPLTPGEGSVRAVDFGRPVHSAMVVVPRFDVAYANGDDHHVLRLHFNAQVERVEGHRVHVRYHGWMHDDSGNRANAHGMSFVVFARLKSQ